MSRGASPLSVTSELDTVDTRYPLQKTRSHPTVTISSRAGTTLIVSTDDYFLWVSSSSQQRDTRADPSSRPPTRGH